MKTCENLQKHYFPNSVENQQRFLERIRADMDNQSLIQLGIRKRNEDKLLGIISLTNIDYINRKSEISLVIGEPEGKDIVTATEAWRLLFWHGFNVLNLNRIYGGSISKAVVDLMCRVTEAKHEGIKKEDVFKNGKYVDAYEYGILKADFNKKYFDLFKIKV